MIVEKNNNPEFDSWDAHYEGREPTSENCVLTCSWYLGARVLCVITLLVAKHIEN